MTKEDHIPLYEHMMALAIKAISISSFGDYFKSDKAVLDLRKNYDLVSGLTIITIVITLSSFGDYFKSDKAVLNLLKNYDLASGLAIITIVIKCILNYAKTMTWLVDWRLL